MEFEYAFGKSDDLSYAYDINGVLMLDGGRSQFFANVWVFLNRNLG